MALPIRISCIIFLLTCSLLFSLENADAARTVRAGVYNYRPLVYSDPDGSTHGLFVEILNKVAQKENWDVQYVKGTWQEGLDRLKNGEIDLLLCVGYSEQRARFMDFPKEFLLLDWGLVYKGKGSNIHSIMDLEGKTVSVFKGSIAAQGFLDLARQFNIKTTVIEKNSFNELFAAVDAKEADAAVATNIPGLLHENRHHVERTPIYFSPVKLGYAVSRGQQADVLAALDREIAVNASAYYHTFEQMMGRHTTKMSKNVVWAIASIAVALLISILFIILLKREVNRKTNSIKKAAEQYHAILKSTSDGFWRVNEHGKLLDVNDRYLELSGFSRDELLGMNIADLEVNESQLEILKHIENITKDGFDRFESRHRRKDNTIWHIEGSISYVSMTNEIVAFLRDISQTKQAEAYREMGRQILLILNEPGTAHDSINAVLTILKDQTGFDAVGIRLQDGQDYPYFVQSGFPVDFLMQENTLIERNIDGGVCRDANGNFNLECTCGLVIAGNADISSPYFTRGGSFWTNDSFPLLDLPLEEDPRNKPRNICVHLGYASVALIPIRNKDTIVGLLQLNDRRKGCFTRETIELLEGIASNIGAALQRRRSEDILKEREQRLNFLLTSTPAVVYTSKSSGDFGATFVSENVQTLLGHQPARFIEDSAFWANNIHPDDVDQVLAGIGDIFDKDFKIHEYRFRHQDGSYRWMHDEVRVLRDENGMPTELIGFWVDISQRKKVEEEKSQIEAKFQQTQRLESLGVLAGGIAHDFNNLLNIIMGHCYIIDENLDAGIDDKIHVQQIENAAERAADICRQMMAYAGSNCIKQARINLWLMVDETVKMLQLVNNKQITVKLDLKFDVPEIIGDSAQVQQVVMNLIINAAEAIGDRKGTVTIALNRETFPAEHHDSQLIGDAVLNGDYACLTVSDDGCGMDEGTKQRIFEPFYTTKSTGRGLGLSAVLGIIRSHEGALRLSSTPGTGTTFSVFFPATGGTGHFEAADAGDIYTAGKVHGTILLVDDDESQLKVGSALLKAMGFTVVTATCGSDALEIYRNEKKHIDLVLLDMIMSDMGGIETFSHLRNLSPALPVVFCSGYNLEEKMSDINSDHLTAGIQKPYKPDQLRSTLMKLLGETESNSHDNT